jgi:hypothetical protein
MASELSKAELNRLARLGAQARLEQIDAERRAILRMFPGLSLAGGRQVEAKASEAAPKKKGRKRRKMTAAEKKAVSDRMKKFWAARKQSS